MAQACARLQSEGIHHVVFGDLFLADIRAYPPADYAGIIVLRLTLLDKFHVLSVLQRLLPVLEREPLVGKLWIVEEASVRVRG